MDTNVEILIELAQFRGLSTAFSGGDRIRSQNLHPLWMQLLRLLHCQTTYYMILLRIEKEKDVSTLMGLATVQ